MMFLLYRYLAARIPAMDQAESEIFATLQENFPCTRSPESKGKEIKFVIFYFLATKSIPHFGHFPGFSEMTSGCMVQVY